MYTRSASSKLSGKALASRDDTRESEPQLLVRAFRSSGEVGVASGSFESALIDSTSAESCARTIATMDARVAKSPRQKTTACLTSTKRSSLKATAAVRICASMPRAKLVGTTVMESPQGWCPRASRRDTHLKNVMVKPLSTAATSAQNIEMYSGTSCFTANQPLASNPADTEASAMNSHCCRVSMTKSISSTTAGSLVLGVLRMTTPIPKMMPIIAASSGRSISSPNMERANTALKIREHAPRQLNMACGASAIAEKFVSCPARKTMKPNNHHGCR
mmetsp:Transcript_53733/g.149045  ORF Transcript_53733/g.149045 Transcript_53733/m.149045 type:complete len:276 (+) Transcript_53733:80-907(+)